MRATNSVHSIKNISFAIANTLHLTLKLIKIFVTWLCEQLTLSIAFKKLFQLLLL